MADIDLAKVIDAISSVAREVEGLKVVHGVQGGSEDSPLVKPAPLILLELPALVLDDGEADVIPGSWERQTWTFSGAIWRPYDAATFAEVYRESAKDAHRLLNLFPTRGKAKSISPDIQSLLLTHIYKTDGAERPAHS